MSRKKKIFPIKFEKFHFDQSKNSHAVKFAIENYQYVDFQLEYSESLKMLVKGLKHNLGNKIRFFLPKNLYSYCLFTGSGFSSDKPDSSKLMVILSAKHFLHICMFIINNFL